jgi:fatty-acyl-CoA synthase
MTEATIDAPAPARPRRAWARPLLWVMLAVALIAPLLVAAGAIGTKLGLLNWKVGFGLLTVGLAAPAAMAGVVAGLVAVALMFVAGWRRTWPIALAALLIPLVSLAMFGGLRSKAQSMPMIHDYATDWTQPLMPSPALQRARIGADNPIEADPRAPRDPARPEVENWRDDRIARIGAEACPGARPVTLARSPREAQAATRRALEAAGLRVLHEAPGTVEAVATSFWYGFKDDVMVRIRPEGAGSRVDLRSVSRVGLSDLGANCERITSLVADLRE